MEEFKIENYERVHGVRSFPDFRSLAKDEADHLLILLKRRLGLPEGLSALEVLCSIDQRSVEVNGIDATEDTFDLKRVLRGLGFSAVKVYVNWYRFDRIDEFEIEEFCNYFGDIFYPAVDDLEIVDASLTWLVSISHYGAVKALEIFTVLPLSGHR